MFGRNGKGIRSIQNQRAAEACAQSQLGGNSMWQLYVIIAAVAAAIIALIIFYLVKRKK